MQSWNLLELEMAEGAGAIVLHSHDEARAVLIGLNPGQALGDHQVHENAWLVVVDGQVEVGSERGDRRGGRRDLFRFDAHERHRVASREGADPAAARTLARGRALPRQRVLAGAGSLLVEAVHHASIA